MSSPALLWLFFFFGFCVSLHADQIQANLAYEALALAVGTSLAAAPSPITYLCVFFLRLAWLLIGQIDEAQRWRSSSLRGAALGQPQVLQLGLMWVANEVLNSRKRRLEFSAHGCD